MTITVVIASYKYGHLAGHAIDSVFSQIWPADQIIFVDDDSCEEYSTLQGVWDNYGNIKNFDSIVRESNMGIIDNFNDILFHHVKTDYVMFLGADNWLRPDALEQMRFKVLHEGADIVSSDIALVGTEVEQFRKGLNTSYENGYHVWKFQYGDIEVGNFIHGSSLYNVKLAREVGGYEANPKGNHTEEDWMLWRKMIRAGATYFLVREPLLYYRRHKNNFNQ